MRSPLGLRTSANFVALYLPPGASQEQVENTHNELEAWLTTFSADFVSVAGDWNTELLSEDGAATAGGRGTGSRAAWRMRAMRDLRMRMGLGVVQERGGTRSVTRYGRSAEERNSAIDHVLSNNSARESSLATHACSKLGA